jgi:DNA invertase Pin-like site-specific DNA recombinase
MALMRTRGGRGERGREGERETRQRGAHASEWPAMTVAAYLRVSSASQDAGMQRDAILRAARARGELVVHWFADTMSGATTKRPELARLRAAVRAGDVRKLYVYRLDRLTRSGIRDTLAIVDELRAHGCTLVTIADGFDVDGPASEVVLAVLAWAAKMERQAIGERIAAARARVAAEGGAWGRPRRMARGDVARARELAAAGKSVRAISAAMKVPRSTLARALRS